LSQIWRAYNSLPTSTSTQYKEVVKLRGAAVDLKQQLNATSAQDEFARWAKLQRQYDKTKADYDKKGTIYLYQLPRAGESQGHMLIL
jgi:hypothetical protein